MGVEAITGILAAQLEAFGFSTRSALTVVGGREGFQAQPHAYTGTPTVLALKEGERSRPTNNALPDPRR